MSYPQVTLGGIPITPEAGPGGQTTSRLGGAAVVRMSDGAATKMTHWGKAAGNVSGSGFLPPGLDGLDFSGPLELRLTKPRSKVLAGTSFVLDAACRPDREPWARALVDNRWVPAACVRVGVDVEVSPVAGAVRYMVQWMPVYQVIIEEPEAEMAGTHNWSFNWEEA